MLIITLFNLNLRIVLLRKISLLIIKFNITFHIIIVLILFKQKFKIIETMLHLINFLKFIRLRIIIRMISSEPKIELVRLFLLRDFVFLFDLSHIKHFWLFLIIFQLVLLGHIVLKKS
jgi:hypothetical protein